MARPLPFPPPLLVAGPLKKNFLAASLIDITVKPSHKAALHVFLGVELLYELVLPYLTVSLTQSVTGVTFFILSKTLHD